MPVLNNGGMSRVPSLAPVDWNLPARERGNQDRSHRVDWRYPLLGTTFAGVVLIDQ